MFCRNCGKEIKDGSKFCSGCGAPTASEAEGLQKTNETAEQGASYSYSYDSPAGQIAAADVAEQTPKSRRKINAVFAMLIGLLVVAGIVAGGLFFYTRVRIASISSTAPKGYDNGKSWYKVLDDCCRDTDWDFSFGSGDENDYVEFTGIIDSSDISAGIGKELYIRFEFIDDDKYKITDFKLDGLSIFNTRGLVTQIVEDIFR